MFYQLKPAFAPIQEKPAEGVPWVEVITQQEMDSQVTQHPYLARSLRHGHSGKAELFDHCAAGALLVPRKEHSPRSGISFAFLLTADRLTFVDDTGQIEVLLEQLSYQPGLGASPGELLLEFLELLIQEDAAFLQHLETQLDKLEEQLLEQAEPQRFENQLHRCRRTLLKLSAYYAQLDELGDTLAANRNGLFSKKLCRGFELFSHRAGRLHSQTASLREYSLQLHQIYQSKIDLKQNRVMQFLTVVTTVFMPLTLITGWYGMNFKNMPEIDWQYGYISVIGFSLLLIVVEYIIFKKKKWM